MKCLFLLALTLAPIAAQAETRCANEEDSVRYLHVGEGSSTRDGEEIGRIQIFIEGNLVSESIAYQNASPQLGVINPDFSEQEVILESKDGDRSIKVFTAKLSLSKNADSASSVNGVNLPAEHSVFCVASTSAK